MHGGVEKGNLNISNVAALKDGFANLERHINNIKNVYNVPVIVAINKFGIDTDEEINTLKDLIKSTGVESQLSEGFEKGYKGCKDLAKAVILKCKESSHIKFAYDLEDNVQTKIQKIANKIYHATGVEYSEKALDMMKKINEQGFNDLPVVIAKTQYSFSDKKELIGAPTDFVINITDLEIRSGAGFIVAIAGNMLLMPGLSKHSAYENMQINKTGIVTGLF